MFSDKGTKEEEINKSHGDLYVQLQPEQFLFCVCTQSDHACIYACVWYRGHIQLFVVMFMHAHNNKAQGQGDLTSCSDRVLSLTTQFAGSPQQTLTDST